MNEPLRTEHQPEADESPPQLAMDLLGLFAAVGLIIGAGVGGMAGNFLLDNAFNFGHDILLGAFVGAILGLIIAIALVMAFARRLAGNTRRR